MTTEHTPSPGPQRRKSGASPEDDNDFGFTAAEVRLSRVVRAVYVRCRSLAESMRRAVKFDYRPPRSYDQGSGGGERKVQAPVWLRLARWLVGHKLEPLRYVHYHLLQPDLERMPEPADLMSATARERFLAQRRQRLGDVRRALPAERTAFFEAVSLAELMTGKQGTEIWGDVLTDDTVSLSPLFRYCLAKSVGGVSFERIAAYYRSSALAQFSQYPAAYARYWEAVLPAGFARSARRDYLRAICNG